jgi:hypothetical protein
VQIAKPNEAVRMKALVHGPSGAGKTYLAGTMGDDERTSPALYLDFKGGIETLVGRDIDVGTVRDWNDYNEAFEELSDPDTKYQSYIVDSASDTQVEGLLALLEKSDRGKAQDDTITQPEWGVILVQMRRFVRHFVDLPMHCLWTSLSDEDLDKREGRIKVPMMQGSFRGEFPGIFGVVGYLGEEEPEDEDDEPRRVLLLHSHPGFRIKARTPMGVTVPSEIYEPTATKLLDALGYPPAGKKVGRKIKVTEVEDESDTDEDPQDDQPAPVGIRSRRR